jgi:hypothetical protein
MDEHESEGDPKPAADRLKDTLRVLEMPVKELMKRLEDERKGWEKGTPPSPLPEQ